MNGCIFRAWGVYTQSRAVYAQSHQRRFRRWRSNHRINLIGGYQALLRQALLGWKERRLDLRGGYDAGVESLLHSVVRRGLPRTDDSHCLADSPASQLHGAAYW